MNLQRRPHFCRAILLFSLCTSILLSPLFFRQRCYADTQTLAESDALTVGAKEQAVVGLAAALQATMSYNPAIKGKRAELNSYEARIDGAKAGRYPSLSAQANNVNNYLGQYEQGIVSIQQPLWAFGKIDNEIDRAEANYHSEQLGLLQVQRQLIENTAAAYARIEGIEKRATVARLNIREHEKLYNRIKRREEGHMASEADMRLAYSRLIQAKTQLMRIGGERDIAISNLRLLTQADVAVDAVVDKDLTELPMIAEVEDRAIKNSADVRYKKMRLDVVAYDVKREKIASLPTLSCRVDYEFLDKPESGDRTSYGLVLEGNLEGMGFTTISRVKGATSREIAAREDVDLTTNDVLNRVRSLMLDRAMQSSLKNAQRESVQIVESTMASFMRQYESGRKSWIDVLNTQRELTELRYQLAQIENDWLTSSLRVLAVTGELDQLAGIESL
ncbi:TolC family protein [Desulfotalea psychrophila]|uniref:Hypothetical outer membrane protein n=1 Tax=Desulfotalea psychrophila (strain LSv54 / DSM 12343) TaxID=177439 RepID=Q6ALD9_DESPS|nr:TolC family protein [Desulfotalea psychrophila]CAG36836.1 hypothetical outer membrane protein [Desulfotalea psychrophila LSv54]